MGTGGTEKLYVIGRITGSFGIRGYVKVKPFTDSLARFEKLPEIYRGFSPETAVGTKVERCEIRSLYVLVKFGDVNDRTGADKLKKQYLFVPENEVAIPGNGRYYIHDIIGCTVKSVDGKSLGVVTEVYKLPAQDVWEIKDGEKRILLPVVREYINTVEIGKKAIVVKLIDGLTDL